MMCVFGLRVDGLITERVYKREEKEKLLSGSLRYPRIHVILIMTFDKLGISIKVVS